MTSDKKSKPKTKKAVDSKTKKPGSTDLSKKVENDNVQEILDKLEELPPNELGPFLIAMQTKQSSFSGPIPSAAEFKKYEDALPGAADRILAMAENEQKTTGRLNAKVVHNSRLRTICAFIITLFTVTAATYLAINDKEILAGLFGLLSIVGAVLSFFLRKSQMVKESE